MVFVFFFENLLVFRIIIIIMFASVVYCYCWLLPSQPVVLVGTIWRITIIIIVIITSSSRI